CRFIHVSAPAISSLSLHDALPIFMSLPALMRRMGRSWKPAQRLLYAAAILTLVHVVTVTIHLRHLRAILIVTYALVTPLLMLELLRFDRWVVARQALPRHLIALVASAPVA